MPIHQVEVQLKNIPYGNAGIIVSAENLVDIIKTHRRHPEIRFLAEDIVSDCPNKAYRCEIDKIYWWVKNNIKFRRDPYRVEMLRSPLINIERGCGDCDDHVILVNSLLQSLGHRTRVSVVATRRNKPKSYNHVFTEVLLPNGKWLPLDTTVEYAKPGWLPPGFLYKRFAVEE